MRLLTVPNWWLVLSLVLVGTEPPVVPAQQIQAGTVEPPPPGSRTRAAVSSAAVVSRGRGAATSRSDGLSKYRDLLGREGPPRVVEGS